MFSRTNHILDWFSAKPFYNNLSLPLLIQPHSVVLYASGMYMQWWYWTMVHG